MGVINALKGFFIHTPNRKGHYARPRYSGMCVVGYKCSKCGYEWYEKR